MWFRKIREQKRLLQLFYDAYFDDKRQSENWIEEIALQLKPEINRERLKIYLIEFLEKGWIEWDKERSDAYIITNKGILYYSSSWYSRLNDNQRITIIGIMISAILVLIGFYLNYTCV